MQLTLDIPEEVVAALELGGAESVVAERVRRDLAVYYYRLGLLSVGRAGTLAGMTRSAFESFLSAEAVDRPWTDDDLRTDLAAAGE